MMEKFDKYLDELRNIQSQEEESAFVERLKSEIFNQKEGEDDFDLVEMEKRLFKIQEIIKTNSPITHK